MIEAFFPSRKRRRDSPFSELMTTSYSDILFFTLPSIFQPIASGIRVISSAVARLSPRPGENNETASKIFVLPVPFFPKTTTGLPSSESLEILWERKWERVRFDIYSTTFSYPFFITKKF